MTRAAGERGRRAETALRGILQERGYVVIRSAASKCLDLICVDPESVTGIEVKSTRADVVYCSRTARQKEQHDELVRINETLAVGACYAVRWEPSGEYEFFFCYDTIMRKGHGVDIDVVFPDLRIAPNNPPIVPHGDDVQDTDYTGDDREHFGGGTD